MISQAVHIFRKDLTYLRAPLGLFLLMTLFFAWVQGSSVLAGTGELLLALSGGLLIARLIHAEAPAGNAQFWITRPYNWRSLLIAKLMFLAICVDIPVGVARLIGIVNQGYPVGSSLPALIWAQLLLFGVIAAIAALAALTAGLMELSLTVLGAVMVGSVVILGMPALMFRRMIALGPWPGSLEWIRDSLAGIVILIATALILLWQYRDRTTRFSRNFAVIAAAGIEIMAFAIPVQAALRLQSLLSSEPAPNVQMELKRTNKVSLPPGTAYDRSSGRVGIPIALNVRGVAAGDEVQVDFGEIVLAWPGGEIARGPADLGAWGMRDGVGSLAGRFTIPRAALNRYRLTPMTLHGSLNLTLFGRPESRTIPFGPKPTNVQDGLQCYTGFQGVQFDNAFGEYRCRAFFGWPSRLVSVRATSDEGYFTKFVSYAPFPSGPALDSMQSLYTTVSWEKEGKAPGEVTIITKRPLVHFAKEFDVTGLRLDDLVGR